MFALIVWSSLIPPLPLALLSYAVRRRPGGLGCGRLGERPDLGLRVVLAWGATLFGFASWARCCIAIRPALIAPFALLIPVSGLASGVILLGESLAPLQVAGVGAALRGIAVNIYGARSSRSTPASQASTSPTCYQQSPTGRYRSRL